MADDVNSSEENEGGIATAADGSENAFEFVEAPTFTIDYKGDCAYEVKVEVAPSNEKKQAEELFGELKDDAELPGFRRGRAPLKLIEKKFGKVVKSEVAGKMVSASFEKLIKDEELRPLGMPDVDGLDDIEERADGDSLEFTLKFEVSPRVELGKYRGIEVERPVVTVDKKDIDEAIDEIRERQAVYEDLKDGVSEEGDQVIIDFKGTVDKEEFEGGSAENYPYILGSQRFFPEFEKALLGKSAGDKPTCTVTFPDDYFSEDLRGKKGKFKITVNEVKRKNRPKLSAKFAKEAGYEGTKDMKEKIGEQLKENTLARSKQLAEGNALNIIIESSTFELPKTLLESIAGENREREIRRLMESRVPMNIIEEQMEAIEQMAREQGERDIKTMVCLQEIGEAEGIEVTDEDFEKEAETISQSMGASAEMVAQYMAQGDQRNTFEDRIFRAKAMAVIMDNAKVSDKELTREEMEEEKANEDAEEEKD